MTDEELNEAIEYNLRHLEHDYSIEEELEETMKCLKETQQELQRKDNIIKQLKKHLEYEIEEWQDVSDEWTKAQVQEDKIILDKINELEGDNK